MKKSLRLFFLFVTSLTGTVQVSAQECATAGRYTTDIFADVTQSPGILFGSNSVRSYSTGTDYPAQNLYLDFYEPTGDAAAKRPLVLLAFGGGFISGSRADLEPLARAYARKGFAVASIDYRIVTNSADQQALAFGTEATKLAIARDVIVKASADMKAAIRFFKHDAATANTYRIDPAKIFIGGASAGAIAALQTAYVDNVTEDPDLTAAYLANGGIEGNTDLPGNSLIGTYSSSGVAGVLNISGAILATRVIDANDPPVYNAHGDNDEVIPYNSGTLTVQVSTILGPVKVTVPIMLYGSQAIDAKADASGLKSDLYTISGGGHETPRQSPYIENINSGSSSFMQSAVCGTTLPVRLTTFTVRANQCNAVLNWQTAMELQHSHYDIEISADGARFRRAATVPGRNAANGASYTYQLEGVSKPVLVRLKMVDINGASAYSNAIRFTPQCEGFSVQVYPNPVQSRATVAGLKAGLTVEVLTADGKAVWSQRSAANTLSVPVSGFAKGLLLLQVKDVSGAVISSTKLVKN